MRAVQATEFGGPEVLVAREVLVEVAAADVMFLDTRLRAGWGTEWFPVRPPYIPGGAVAGTVRAVGMDVDRAWLGKTVATITASSSIGGGLPIGGYAELAPAKAQSLIEVPEAFTTRAVAVVHDGRTALGAFERAAVQAGDQVLITAAGGGMGTLLIQFAHRAGAKVIAAARGSAKLELASRLGADTVIDYSQDDWAEQVVAATGGSGPRVVFDGAGGALGSAALAVTADGGRFIGYGAAAGDFAAGATSVDRDIDIVGLSNLRSSVDDRHRLGVRIQAEVAAGRVKPVVGQTFPLEQADRAHAAIEVRAAIGRTVLTV
ncbi:zinc-binding dehydrogenase [Nocardia brevicatena]|uniref:zinc-binding dehydrogenase n=1 Tax=Nocardia brevicatena TaxID=37327 RepID=UPI000307B13D|nr:zinc-binding dehydrogenase [Nocardia brevicatena]